MMISFFISLALAQPAAKSCPAQTVKWDKCEASTKILNEGERIVLEAQPSTDKKACYTWTGKATVECKKGKIAIQKKQSTCTWECICCY